ncbi:hypothetical protein GF318_06230 [Candidatus Micrarchaeota archaeon]|nr:hypothetical protein [Candidatus Micrarchaeota archaeon]
MKICIATQKSVEGKRAVKVKEDRIIKAIRAIKKALGIAQMNELYVSEEHLEEHLKRRRSFEKSILFASVVAGLLVIAVLAALFLSGRFDLWAVVSALIVGTFVLALPLFKYAPAVESKVPKVIGAPPPAPEEEPPLPEKAAAKPAGKKAQAKKKKPARKKPKKKKR